MAGLVPAISIRIAQCFLVEITHKAFTQSPEDGRKRSDVIEGYARR